MCFTAALLTKKVPKKPAGENYFSLRPKNWRSTLDKTEKLVIIELDDLASSLFRPRRFASPRAAGFLFFNGFCEIRFFPDACHEFQVLAFGGPCCSLASAWIVACLRCRSSRRRAREDRRSGSALAQRPPDGHHRLDPIRHNRDARGLARPRRRSDRSLRNGPARCGPGRSALACGPTRRRRSWLARIDLLVSVRTDRLDWRHDVRLESVLPEAAEIESCDSTGSMFATGDWSLALMVHPADLGPPGIDRRGRGARGLPFTPAVVSDRIVGKGRDPSRRARAWFLPSGVDSAAMATCFAEFAAADPPLGICT